MALVKFMKETWGKQSVWESIKAGGWRAAIDGTLAETTLIHGPGAELVGSDSLGNKYYERNTEHYGRHRWVVYANKRKDDQDGQEPTTIAAEWHAWLHCISDRAPSRNPVPQPIYLLKPESNKTMTADAYFPKGSWWNEKKRNWTKIETWKPPGHVSGKLPPQA